MTNGHQGWSNEAGLNVNLWLANDRDLCAHVNLLQRVWYVAEADEWGRVDSLSDFARAISNYCLALWPAAQTPDGHDLGDVDWLELAAHWVEP